MLGVRGRSSTGSGREWSMRPSCTNPVVSLSNHDLVRATNSLDSSKTELAPPTRRPSPAEGPEVRRVRGCLFGNPGPVPSGPGGFGCASLGTPSGSLRPCSGPVGRLAAPASAICVPGCNALASGLAPLPEPSPLHLEPAVRAVAGMHAAACLCRQRIASGPPGSRAIPLSFRAPAVATRTVNGPTHVPSQATVAVASHSPGPPGISPAHQRCPHGESRPPSPTRPSSPKPRPCAEAIGDPAPTVARASGFPLTLARAGMTSLLLSRHLPPAPEVMQHHVMHPRYD